MARGGNEKQYKIGEVCKLADVQPYVLRYWETEFPQLAPDKSGGGQRLYNQREIDVVLRIKELLYKEGFTIAGAKKKLEAEASAPAAPPAGAPAPAGATSSGPGTKKLEKALAEVRAELNEILRMLREPG